MTGLQELISLVEQSLDEADLSAAELAGRAFLSRFHFDRLARAMLDEPMGALRRRLFLERAAHRLVATSDPVIEVALDAGYDSPDAFTRAFNRAYGRPPSRYRRQGPTGHDLPTPNGIHFHPPGGLRLSAEHRSTSMDVLTKMYDHHVELTGSIVDRLSSVPDEVLDRPIQVSVEGIDTDPTLRLVCERLVRQLEMWNTAIEGGSEVPAGESSPAALRTRLTDAGARFRTLVLDPVVAGRAGSSFLDATCQPPETFTLGGVLAHVLTFSAARRTMAIGALESAGITDLGAGDPMAYVGGTGNDASEINRSFA